MFDTDGTNIFGNPPQYFYEKALELGDVDIIPQKFDEVVGKRYAFKVEVKEFNITWGGSTFGIKTMTEDEHIVGELVKKSNVHEVAESESFNINLNENDSQTSV